MSNFLQGKVALITGSGRQKGLGQGIARALGSQGAQLMLHDIGEIGGDTAPEHGVGTSSQLRDVVSGLVNEGMDAQCTTGDLSVESNIERVVHDTVEAFGRLDILVNNAGIGYLFGPLTELSQEHWDAVLAVNLRAPALASKHAAQQMIKQGEGGRIINIASQAGKSGFAFASAYTASKHGLIGLTRSAALELGEHGITVNAICPNHVTTGLGAWQNDFMSKARGQSMEQYLQAMRERIPMQRVGTPEDTANVAAFLASPAGEYVTAEAINVSGGEEYH